MQMAMGVPPGMGGAGMAGAPGAPFMAKTAYKAEASALSVVGHGIAGPQLGGGEAALIAQGRTILQQRKRAGHTASADGVGLSKAVPGRAVSPARRAPGQ